MTYLLRLIPLALLLTACAFIPPGPGDTVRDCDTCPELTLVPAGTFVMGAPADDPESDGDEGPQHDVTIAAALAIGTTEVTRAQFAAFIAATGYAPEPGCRYFTGAGFDNDPKASWAAPRFAQTGDHPVVCVNWYDALAYVTWLRDTTGKPYRLPSEAEWEYAVRGGTTTRRFWGDGPEALVAACTYANALDATSQEVWPDLESSPCDDGHLTTNPVGAFAPNPFGLEGMTGNVWEWTEDCWHDSYDGAPADGRAWLTGACDRRVLRGASWDDVPKDLRSSNRLGVPAENRYNSVGLRVVRDATEIER